MLRDVAEQIEAQIQFLHRSRSVFPHLLPSVVGCTSFKTAPFYKKQGLNYSFHSSTPFTAESVEQFNDLGHWINQNFVVRLCAVLESNGILSPIQQVDGHAEVDILRRLRNVFAHGSGRYDRCDPEKRKLFDRIVSHFQLSQQEYTGDGKCFPIPIDKVLVPIGDGCKRYAIACEPGS